MEITEIKRHLHEMIDTIEDADILNEIDDFISDVVIDEETPLSDLQKRALNKSIQRGLKDFEEGRVHTFDEVKKRFPEWPSD